MRTVWILIISALVCLPLSDPAIAGDAEEYRVANAALLRSVRTAVVEYREEEVRHKVYSEEQLNRLFRNIPQPERDEHIRLLKINTVRRMKNVKLYFQAEPAAWKVESQDLRDLDRIITEQDLAPAKRSSLDGTQVSLVSEGLTAVLRDEALHLLSKRQMPEKSDKPSGQFVLRSPLFYGAIADNLIEEATTLLVEPAGLEDDGPKRVTLATNSVIYEMEVDPSIDWHYGRLLVYDNQHVLRYECLAEDYRLVNGVYYPFRIEKRTYEPDGTLTVRKTIEVQSAVFNQELPSHALEINIPAGAMVYVEDEDHRTVNHFMEEERTMGVSALDALMEKIHPMIRLRRADCLPGNSQMQSTGGGCNIPEPDAVVAPE